MQYQAGAAYPGADLPGHIAVILQFGGTGAMFRAEVGDNHVRPGTADVFLSFVRAGQFTAFAAGGVNYFVTGSLNQDFVTIAFDEFRRFPDIFSQRQFDASYIIEENCSMSQLSSSISASC